VALRRVVVVGCGSIGQRHAQLLSKRPDLRLELCDTQRDSLSAAVAAVGEARCHSDFEQVLATRPAMMVIATPHTLHAGQTIAALRAGVHVLCEKPMSDNLADARRMAATAAKGKPVLDFGFQLHFHPGLRRLKELISAGELGAVLHVHCRVGTYVTLASSRSRHQTDLEGALLLDYAHQPDLLYWLLGIEPRGAYMAAVLGGDLPLRSNPNVLSVTLDYDKPLLATIHLNYVQAPQRHEYEVVGDRAWAVLDMETNCLRIGWRERQTETTETFVVDRDKMYQSEHQAFLDAIDGRRRPESPASTAMVSMRIIHAAMRSWKRSRRQRLPARRETAPHAKSAQVGELQS
jgi:predicted dehydrogenase